MVNVIEISEGVVYQNLLFTGKDAVKKAEAAFAKLARSNSPSLISNANMEVHIEDGYFMNQNWAVCITHPDVRK